MSTDVTRRDRENRQRCDDDTRDGPSRPGAPFDPWRLLHGQIPDVLVSELLKTRPARPPNLESENAFLHSLAQHLLTDPEHILERSIRKAARLCGAGSAGVSLLEPDHGHEVFRWVALGGAFEGQEGRSNPRFFSPCGLAFDRQTPQLFSYPARYYTCLHDALPEIVEALVVPLPDGTGTIWIVAHDEATRFDGEHARLLTGLATFTATSLRLLRLTHEVKRARGETERDLRGRQGDTVEATSPGAGSRGESPVQLPLPQPADSLERGAVNVPTFVAKKAANDLVVDESGFAPGERQQDTPQHAVTARTQMNEILLAFRALVEQVRLALRDGRRLVRQLIALCATSKRKSRVQMTSDPVPLVLVPLVVLASTTEREQIELHDLVQSLSAEGHQIAHRGHHWTVYTKITDRRTSGIGRFRRTAREQRRSVNRFEAGRFDCDRREPAPSGVCPPNTVTHGAKTVTAGEHPGAQTATVLIVDDDPITVDTFAQVLRLEGYEVRTALSAEDGLRVVRESGPDAILVDYRLPRANGVEFLRRLRACEAHRETPAAIVTGDRSLDDTLGTELHQLGARVAFKPLCVAELVELTSRLLAGRNSVHELRPPSDVGEHHRIHL